MNSFPPQSFLFSFIVTEQNGIQFPKRKTTYCNVTFTIVCKYIFQINLTHQIKFNFIWIVYDFTNIDANEINH